MTAHSISLVIRAPLLAWLLVAWLALAGAGAQAAGPVEVSASHKGRLVEISMRTQVTAPHHAIWSTLTDYENTPNWVPGMVRSVVLNRTPTGAVVEQTGRAGVLFFDLGVQVVVEVTESPPQQLHVKALGGDFKHLDGGYNITESPNEPGVFELTWRGTLELASGVPGFVAEPILRKNLQQQFAGVVAEIERRAKATP